MLRSCRFEVSLLRSKAPRMRSLRGFLSYSFLSTLIATALAATCYNPDGSDRNGDPDVPEGYTFYTPCSQVTKFSMCCRAPNNGGDDCRPDGLCQGYASDGSLPIWRESCTDQTWQSPYCLNLCTTGVDDKGEESTCFRIPKSEEYRNSSDVVNQLLLEIPS